VDARSSSSNSCYCGSCFARYWPTAGLPGSTATGSGVWTRWITTCPPTSRPDERYRPGPCGGVTVIEGSGGSLRSWPRPRIWSDRPAPMIDELSLRLLHGSYQPRRCRMCAERCATSISAPKGRASSTSQRISDGERADLRSDGPGLNVAGALVYGEDHAILGHQTVRHLEGRRHRALAEKAFA
jgi:hypothetical protein